MPESQIVFKAAGGYGPIVTARCLVSSDAFSPRYDLDRATGVISRRGHALEGQCIAGTVLVLPAAKGGVAAGWSLYTLKDAGLAPVAFVFSTVNPVFIQGAVHAGISILHGMTPDPIPVLVSGQMCVVDPERLELRSGQLATGGEQSLGLGLPLGAQSLDDEPSNAGGTCCAEPLD